MTGRRIYKQGLIPVLSVRVLHIVVAADAMHRDTFLFFGSVNLISFSQGEVKHTQAGNLGLVNFCSFHMDCPVASPLSCNGIWVGKERCEWL